MRIELPRDISKLVAKVNQVASETVRGDPTFRRHLGCAAAFPPNPGAMCALYHLFKAKPWEGGWRNLSSFTKAVRGSYRELI